MVRRVGARAEGAAFMLIGLACVAPSACSESALSSSRDAAEEATGGVRSSTGGAGGEATGGTRYPGAGGTYVTSCAVAREPGKGPGEGTQNCSEVGVLEAPVRPAPATPLCDALINDGPAVPIQCPTGHDGDLCGGCIDDGLYDLVSFTLGQSNCGSFRDATAQGVLRVTGDEIEVATSIAGTTSRRHKYLFVADRGTLWLREICSNQGFFDSSQLQKQSYGYANDELRLPFLGTFRRRR